MKLGMVFPGQGSQSVGMLKGYEGLPEVDAVRAEAASALGGGFLQILDQGPAEQLNLTVNTQPAMVTAAIAAYRAWRALGGGPPPQAAGAPPRADPRRGRSRGRSRRARRAARSAPCRCR